jgi:hypothetical protein
MVTALVEQSRKLFQAVTERPIQVFYKTPKRREESQHQQLYSTIVRRKEDSFQTLSFRNVKRPKMAMRMSWAFSRRV